MRLRPLPAFSLLEVVVAIAVAAGGVAVVLALLPGLVRRTEDAADVQTALRLPDAIEAELARAAGGTFPAGLAQRRVLVADKAGAQVRAVPTSAASGSPPYFYIDVRPFDAGELAYRPSRPVLPLRVRVCWPYAAVVSAGGPDQPGAFQAVGFVVTLTP